MAIKKELFIIFITKALFQVSAAWSVRSISTIQTIGRTRRFCTQIFKNYCLVFHILSCTMAFCGWKISRISPVIDFLISVKYQHSWYSPLEGYFTDITNKSHYLQVGGPGVAVKQYSQSFTYKKRFYKYLILKSI